MYYSASVQAKDGSTPHCIGLATSSSPTGYFTPSDDVLICPKPLSTGTGVIDASYVQGINGGNYLVYKYGASFDAAHASQIQLVQLDKTGTQITQGPQTLYTSTKADFDAEGPAITISPAGTFFLFYVVGQFNDPNYAIHYVTSTSGIWGPYGTSGSVLMETGTVGGDGVYVLSPGGPEFIDANQMMFMATVPNNSSCLADGAQISNPRVAKLLYPDATHVTLAP